MKHSYDTIHLGDPDDIEALREVCDPSYDGDLTPYHILDSWLSDVDPLVELTIVDDVDGEPVIIFDEQS